MIESEAKKHWREFEQFVLDYLKEKYNIIDEDFAILTPPTNDGGYDGILYSNVNDLNGNIREIIFEAKLRSAVGTSLPLNDFSKALIIAVNRFTDEVYIASNLVFSSETLRQLHIYAKRLDIKIETVNGKCLYEWYNNKKIKTHNMYSPDFIGFLKKSSDAISLDVCENYQDILPLHSFDVEYIKDIERNKQINSIEDKLLTIGNGLVLLQGGRGYGKSCMCMEIQHNLKEQGYNIFEINMNEHNTSRAIFMKLLECIWGISPETIVLNSLDEIDKIFHCIGTYNLISDDINCLKFIFSKNIKEYTGSSDVFQYILLNILEKLFYHYAQKSPYCIHIHNMESAYEESCEFIKKIIEKLGSCKIVFLVEIRTDYVGDLKISISEWKKVVQSLKNTHNIIGSYEVCKFSLTEMELCIAQNIPSLRYEQIRQLAQSLPNNPLMLDAILRNLQPKLSNNCLYDSEFQKELRYFMHNYDSEILKELLSQIIQRNEYEYLPQFFAMLSLLNGSCLVENIENITGAGKTEIISSLSQTGLVVIKDNTITIKHEFYIKTLQNFSCYISSIELKELAQQMIDKICLFYNDILQQSILLIKLLNINQDYPSLLLTCNKTGKVLLQQGDYGQALEIYNIAYKTFEAKIVDSFNFVLLKLEIIEYMIIAKWNIKGGNDEETDSLFVKFVFFLNIARKNYKHHIKYKKACILKILFEMKKMHIKSEHKKCLQYAYIANRLLKKINGYQNFPSVLEQVLWLKSLSIKHISGMEACLESFKYEIQKYPELFLLQFSYNTHKAAYIANSNPKGALLYFKGNRRFYTKISMSEQLHNRVNISNMYFYLKDYYKSKEMSNLVIKDALLYDINLELGRAYNTIANCYCVEKKYEYSVEFYNKSIAIFEKIQHSIHLWPPTLNCAFVHVMHNNYTEAYNLLKKVNTIFIKRIIELGNSKGKEVYNLNKLNIGVIITLYLLRCISENIAEAKSLYYQLLNKTKNYLPAQISLICSDNKEFEKYFSHTVYEHDGYVLLKL